MKRLLSMPVIFLIIFIAVAATGDNRPLLGPDKWPEPGGKVGEDALAFHKPSRTYENAYRGLMFFTEDGWKFVANLFYFKLGPQYKWGISVTAADKGNNYYFGKGEINSKTLKFNPKNAEIFFGESFIKGKNPNYHVHYVTDKITADLHLKSRVGMWAPNGDGKFRFGPDDKWFFRIAFAAPWSDITGTLTINGKTHKIKGQGYMDQGHWSVPFNRHFPIWEGFQAWTWKPVDGHMWAITVYDHVIHPAFGGNRLANAYIIRDNELVCTTPKFKITASNFKKDIKTGVEFPWRIDVRSDPDAPCFIAGTSRAQYSWEVLDVFGELPDYMRRVAMKFLKRPVYFRAFGGFKGKIRCGDEEVLLDLPAFHNANYVR